MVERFLHSTGVLMEHFLEVIALLRHWYIDTNEKSKKYKFSHLNKYHLTNKSIKKSTCFCEENSCLSIYLEGKSPFKKPGK